MNPFTGMQQAIVHPPRKSKPGRTRWWVVWTLFFSTVINYISRQTFSVLAPLITTQFHLNHAELARILGAFQISYAITWLLGGIFLDAVGTRIGLAVAVVWWSLVNILTGFASSVFSFVAFRFMLGIGEGVNWPGASKAVAEWFPSEERSVAVAIFDSGSSVGGALAALVIPWIAMAFGWRWSFVFSGDARIRLAGGMATCLSPARPPSASHERGGCAHPCRAGEGVEVGAQRYLSLAAFTQGSECLGYCAWAGAHRPDLVVLCLLATAVSERCSGIQPETYRPVRVGTICRSRSGEFYRRSDLRLLHSTRSLRDSRSYLDLRGKLSANSGGYSVRPSAQRVCCSGTDLCGPVGLCELVHNGPHSAFRSFSARGRCHGYGAQRVSSGTWRRRFHFCGGTYGRSIFVWAGISCSRALAPGCNSLLISSGAA